MTAGEAPTPGPDATTEAGVAAHHPRGDAAPTPAAGALLAQDVPPVRGLLTMPPGWCPPEAVALVRWADPARRARLAAAAAEGLRPLLEALDLPDARSARLLALPDAAAAARLRAGDPDALAAELDAPPSAATMARASLLLALHTRLEGGWDTGHWVPVEWFPGALAPAWMAAPRPELAGRSVLDLLADEGFDAARAAIRGPPDPGEAAQLPALVRREELEVRADARARLAGPAGAGGVLTAAQERARLEDPALREVTAAALAPGLAHLAAAWALSDAEGALLLGVEAAAFARLRAGEAAGFGEPPALEPLVRATVLARYVARLARDWGPASAAEPPRQPHHALGERSVLAAATAEGDGTVAEAGTGGAGGVEALRAALVHLVSMRMGPAGAGWL